MAKVGDRVTVTIRGPNVLSGTATATGTTTIGGATSITVKGRIIGELDGNWLLEFDDPLFGGKRMALPKGKVRVAST